MSDDKRQFIEVTENTDQETLMSEWQLRKDIFRQRDREESIQRGIGAVALLRHYPSVTYPQVEPVGVLKEQVGKMSVAQVNEKRKKWADHLKDFKEFLVTVKEKESVPKKELDMSYGFYVLGPVSSKDVLDRLIMAVPQVKKAVGYVQEIIEIYNQHLKFLSEEEVNIPVWLKQTQELSKRAKKASDKINAAILEAKELKRTDKPAKAKQVLEKVLPLLRQYNELSIEYGKIAINLVRHNIQKPFFPEVSRNESLEQMLRQQEA